ncbi:MAG: hypothetical protein IPH89_15705 [Bacteroidetes bacterium]|nr:hypothetical protein [Bacteroidota bacterium]
MMHLIYIQENLRITLANKIQTNSISNNNVRAVIEDNEGIIWMGTDEGLNAFDRKTKKLPLP